MAIFVFVPLLAMALVFDTAYSDLICGSSSCNGVKCDSLSPNSCKSGSDYREKHAGKCACCPACVTLLDVGQRCQTYSKELGETPSSICKEPFLCIAGKCTTPPLKYDN